MRHPLDRFVSAANYVFSGGNFPSDRAWLIEYGQARIDINEIIKNELCDLVKNKIHFMPQCTFVLDVNGNVAVDYIGKIESINHHFDIITSKIKRKRILKYENQTKVNLYSKEELSIESRLKIYEVYRADFDLFGYKLDT